MANYYAYSGFGGLYTGSYLPNANATIDSLTEKVLAVTPFQDGRVGVQAGVKITADIIATTSTTTVATFYCRQSTLGTAAITGNRLTYGGNTGPGTYVASIGTEAGTLSGLGEAGLFHARLEWYDLTGTFPIPSYCLTATLLAGTATITYASITATPLGA